MKKILVILFVALAATTSCYAQDNTSYKRIVKELSSKRYQGRGYARHGVIKAGNYIERQFVKAGVDEVVRQPYAIDINTFPGKMNMWADGHKLVPGTDFVMREFSPGVKGTYRLYYVDTAHYDGEQMFADLAKPENEGAMVVCDFWFSYKHARDFKKLQTNGYCNNSGVIFVWNTPLKFYKAYGERVIDKPVVWVDNNFDRSTKEVTFDIEHRFMKGYASYNIIAKVEGERHDQCYVVTAHYDHLGNMGRHLYFPGANDNASGTAAIITLAAHYAKHKPQYDIYFIAFSGEEAGLRGSTYFAKHPTFDLAKVRYLFNLDMIGDNNPDQYVEVSQEGMDGFHKMERIAKEQQLFHSLKLGELASNSDHYPFAERHVPCILFENEEGVTFPDYHTPRDNYKNAVFTTYPSIFKLVTGIIE